MNNEIKKQVPKSALALYVKLFCKKRGSKTRDNKVLIEATKSWLALNKNDKQQFLKKYHEYQNNIKKAFANYLKKTEPYLKVKEKKPDRNIIQENTINMQGDEEIELNTGQNQNNQFNVGNPNSSLSPHDDSHYNPSMQFLENTNNSNYVAENGHFSIVEPTPPKFITGEQLFTMLNKENHLTWSKLNVSQKRKYQKAVLTIKRKYLKNYQTYLEQLSPEQLFQHYKDCLV
ncbi:unnamed protein product [Euphydryas editha]|uniref:HMG box domain-containing protein n=1 Tax=Euphydryas editha TaxID=104508 RepID=A0AAU9UT62_EUPED|nr:unnamed protein product [Euphydryas editha]